MNWVNLCYWKCHKHMGIGGIVAAAGISMVKEIVFYIEDMAKRD